jgi:hypothetical protein
MSGRTMVIAFLAFGGVVALAQETAPTPAAEVGMNFSFLNIRPGTGAASFNAPGGSGTFVYNFNNYLGAVGDLGGYHNTNDFNFNPTTFTYLFGPRLSIRKSRAIPYVQTLFGGARQWTSFFDPILGPATAQNGFAAAFGGGLDIRVKDHLIVKPFQMEYLLTKVANPWSTATSQNNFRYTAGITFTFGSK